MSILTNSFAGGTAGTLVSTANSGGASGNAFTAVAGLTFANIGGRLGAQSAAPGTATAVARWSLPELATTVKRIVPFRISALPAADLQVVRVNWGSTIGTDTAGSFHVVVLSTGRIRLTTIGAGGSTVRFTGSTYTILPDTEYRLEVYATLGTSTTTGSIRATLYLIDGTTALEDTTLLTGIDLGGTGSSGFTNALSGKLDGGNYTGTLTLLPNVAAKTQTDAINAPEPLGNSAPVVSAGANQNVAAGAVASLSATASDPEGQSLTYSWAFTYPLSGAPTLTGATTATPSFTVGAAGSLYTLTCSVSDGTNVTVSAPTEVRVQLAASGTEMRPIAGAPLGTWTIVGGTTGAVLADESDTTYIESPVVTATEATTRSRYQPSVNRTDGTVTVRLAKTDTGSATAKVRLFIGSGSTTVIEEWTITPTTTPTDYPHALTGATISAVTAATDGWNQIRIEVAATT